MDFEFKNPFLQTYLEYVEDTESPRLFHIWAALSGVSACLGRRVTLPFGITDIFANQYILLVGPPGVRKSTATNIMKRLVKDATGIRFAQDDTGGQRQGLISAFQEDELDEELQDLMDIEAADIASSLEAIGNMQLKVDSRDAHTLYAVASEFNTFIGHNSIDMITFLAKMWDGEDYDYRIKNSRQTLTNPLLNLIGGTTPTNIASSMPPEAIGQGFMSRIILVFGNKKYKSVPRPKRLDPDLEMQLKNTYGYIYNSFDGIIQETPAARDLIDSMYHEEVKINDPRFVYYAERRHVHLIKLCMALAAARRSNEISVEDIEEASAILRTTEQFMSDALGEYGLSPLSASKQKMVEFLRHAKGPVREAILWTVMSKDMRQVDFRNSLMDLVNAGKIIQKSVPEHGVVYIYKEDANNILEEALAGLAEENKDEANVAE